LGPGDLTRGLNLKLSAIPRRPTRTSQLAPPSPIEPMLAKLTSEIPDGDGWLYEPKWDGFRCLLYFDGENDPYLQSRDLKPLGRREVH